jgi:uncharacterized protein (DUF58 family)
MLSDHATTRSPARIELAELINLKAAGESITLTSLRIQAASAGGHLSRFKGRGVEFDESRPYEEGDDLRTIDWRVTARTGKPYTKVFREERDRPVIVWLDLRMPMLFATHGAFKAVRASQTAALIAWSSVAHGDRLGGLVFSEGEHLELRPKLGRSAALRFFRALAEPERWDHEATRADDDGERALLRLTRVARPGSLVFMLSDFRNLGPSAERHIRQLARHCEVFLVHFYDPIERELPPPGRYRVTAAGRTFAIETDSAAARQRYGDQFAERRGRFAALARAPSIYLLECSTTDDPRAVLAQRFNSR